jgi:pepF/M3 family oligoendopeptidase
LNLNWNLDDLYKGFDDEFTNDIESLKTQVKDYTVFTESLNVDESIESQLVTYVEKMEAILVTARRLMAFNMLRASANTQDMEANKYRDVLGQIMVTMARPNVLIQKWLKEVGDVSSILEKNELLKERSFVLLDAIADTQYMLSEDEEVMYANMQQFSSSSWAKLFQQLTSTLEVDYEFDGKTETKNLSEVRNMAFDSKVEVRKAAYESELKAYEKIDSTMAMVISNIKREVNYMNDKRGYASPIDKTLKDSRMSADTLNAMIDAMKESLPAFRSYLKKKAEYLGHDNGLPFYDLKAPIGKMSTKYTYDQARDFVIENFNSFSSELGNFAKKAIESEWLDVEPRAGKVGGAFCYNLPFIGQSRFLLNFQGSFSSVKTMAHELGHGYHGHIIKNEVPMNWTYPMPLAETASILCETIVTNNVLKGLEKEEKLFVLEQQLQASTAVIVDILSRYIFETNLFEATKSVALNKNELNEMMLEAQKESYGDGLDHDFLHPYMWVNKSHYYRPSLSFYNFPYAFGLLYAKGLYAKYLEDKDGFVKNYDYMLSLTGKESVENVAKAMDIDVTDIEFWRTSLKQIESEIEVLNNLMDELK